MIRIQPNIDYDCDVLIVGGGPAGSSLACHLSKANIKTVVIEAECFPRDKVCGDGVSPVALRELHNLGVTRTQTFKKANTIKHVGLFMKDDQAFIQLEKPDELPYHARIIPRLELDYMIYQVAKQAGAKFHENCRVVDYQVFHHKVITTCKNSTGKFQITSKLIVGADGSRSFVGRKLRGTKPDPAYQLLGLRTYYQNVNGPNDRVDVYFSEENFPGIFWLFPKGEKGANVGMAMVYKTCPNYATDVRQSFANHLATNPDLKKRLGKGKATEKMQGWPITFYDSRNAIIADRVLLVGEAGGLINPFSGDGIQYAVLSARWAAESIIGRTDQNDYSEAALHGYKEQLESELLYDFSLSNLLVQFGRNKTLGPLWINFLKILIARCKKDPKFAGTVAGIFEGTYPSYKALDLQFILKICFQAGLDVSTYFTDGLNKPEKFIDDGKDFASNIQNIFRELAKNPKPHLNWLFNVAGKTLNVARHTIRRK